MTADDKFFKFFFAGGGRRLLLTQILLLSLLSFVAKTAKGTIPKKHETEALKKTLRFEQQV